MASGCWRKAGRDEEAVKVNLIRSIADLPLRLVYRLRDRVPLTLE